MLIKSKTGSEALRHLCDNKSISWLDSKPEIFLHDIHLFIDTGELITEIKYCPYCGVLVDNEQRP